MYFANGLTHGNTLPSTSSLPEQSALPAVTSTQTTGEGGLPLDRLEAQLNALRQQALSTQKSIQQFQSQDEGPSLLGLGAQGPWGNGAQGLVVGLGAVLLGWVVVRLLLGRVPPVSAPVPARVAPAAADFAESRFYLTDAAPLPVSVARTSPQAELSAAMQRAVPVASAFPEADFAHSAPVADSESVLNLFWDAETPTAAPVTEPLTEPFTEPLSEPVAEPAVEATAELPAAEIKVDSPSFAPQRAYLEFDPQVAASEVERVRRSLAEKREERNRQRVQDETRRHHREHMEMPYPPEVHAYREQSLDLDLDLDVDLEPVHGAESETIAPALLFAPQGMDMDTDGLDDAVDAYLDAHAPEPEEPEEPQEPDSSIQLALAQEFAALGLLDGARELAQEVLGSAYAPLQMEAQALLSELDAQETAQRAEKQGPPEET